MAFGGVPCQGGHQGGGDRLPADRLALFPQQDQALLAVQVGWAKGDSHRLAEALTGKGVIPLAT
jgi:hypothetical protein